MRAEEVKGLMEAYSHVYETPEVLSEGVVEEDIEVLDEAPNLGTGGTAQDMINRGQAAKTKAGGTLGAGGGQAAMKKLQSQGVSARSAYAKVLSQGERNLSAAAKPPAAKPATNAPAKYKSSSDGKMYANYNDALAARNSRLKAATSTPTGSTKPTTPAASTPAAKPAATTAPKPTTPAAKPAGSAMDQWAKANPKLAAAKAERDRTRGTSATTNPLMKDTKSSLPDPKSPTPTSAPKPTTSTLSQATAAASKPSAFTPMKKEHLDIFDIVKGHLLDEGYAETEEAAMVIMTNMSEEWRESILDENRMASRMGKMSSPPAKVGKATHSIKDLVPSKPPSEEEKEKARKALRKEGLDPVGQEDDDIDNDRKKNTKSDKYLKNRRKVVGAAIQKEELEAWVDQLIAEGYDLSEYTWEEVAEIYAEELELGENRRMAADPEGRESGHSKQPDPSKEGFTGIGNMSIKQIMALNKKIAAKKKED